MVDVEIADVIADVGKTALDSEGVKLKLISAEEFASEIDRAKGITSVLEVGGTPVYTTSISFARVQIMAVMTTASYDDRDLRMTTQDLGRQLDEQVRKLVRYP
jgi:hypothetical protein